MSLVNSAKKDLISIAILIAIALLIFYPVLYNEYAYTDELVGLWQWNHGTAIPTAGLLQYGRFITGKAGEWLFGSIDSIHQLTSIRIISIAGWILSIPVWYYILNKVTRREKLPTILCFFSVLYLICTPCVSISIGWAACFELFFANTFGLLAGYFLYARLKAGTGRRGYSILLIALSLLTGVASLFTYQNGFGCFLLPFLLHFIASSKITKTICISIAVYFLIYGLYYLLFKLSLSFAHIEESGRTGLHINVGRKLPFFLARPLGSAFRLTWLSNEKNISGYIIYAIVAAAWFIISWIQKKGTRISERISCYFIVFCLLGLIYLPSLIVSENYSSNRTMLALSMAVFLLVAQTFLTVVKTERSQRMLVIIVSTLFVFNGWYNFNVNFLKPVKKEYTLVRSFIESNYTQSIEKIHFIRPPEDFFEKRFGITRSWDEFGVPSSFFQWTPEFLLRQVILEKTGDLKKAEKLIITTSLPADTTLPASADSNTLMIDARLILK